MRVKYNRVSTLQQTGNRFTIDTETYDLVLMDKVSGAVPFKERPKATQLVELLEEDKVSELVFEDLSRCGRNTGDVIRTLEWLEEKEVNVIVRNLGLQSRPNGKRNPIWKMLTSVLCSLYEMELDNIKERTQVGRQIFVQNGGTLGRPVGTKERADHFLKKPKSKLIKRYLDRGMSYSEVSRILACSPKTIKKVKDLRKR